MEFGLLKLASDEHMQRLIDHHRMSHDEAHQSLEDYEAAKSAYDERVGIPEKILRGATLVGAPVAGALLGHGLTARKLPDVADAGGMVGGLAGLAAGALGQRGIRSAYDRRDEERAPLREERDQNFDDMFVTGMRYHNAAEDASHAAIQDPVTYGSLVLRDLHPADSDILHGMREAIRERRMNEQEDRQLERETMRSTRDLNRQQLER